MNTTRKPLKVGITGGIGSGKTFVCELFRKLNVPVYNSDLRAKELMNSNEIIKNALVEIFGKNIYFENGSLNKQLLAEKIFADKEALKFVNETVHPQVANDFEKWCLQQNSPYILKEAAILFESGANKQLDYVITIYVENQVKMKRLALREGFNQKDVENRMKQQISDIEKIQRANFVIVNFGTLLLPQIVGLDSKLCEISKSRS